MREDHAAHFAGFLPTLRKYAGLNLALPVSTVRQASQIQLQLSS